MEINEARDQGANVDSRDWVRCVAVRPSPDPKLTQCTSAAVWVVSAALGSQWWTWCSCQDPLAHGCGPQRGRSGGSLELRITVALPLTFSCIPDERDAPPLGSSQQQRGIGADTAGIRG